MNLDYDKKVENWIFGIQKGEIRDLSGLKDRERFIQSVKKYIDRYGDIEFNESMVKLRKI